MGLVAKPLQAGDQVSGMRAYTMAMRLIQKKKFSEADRIIQLLEQEAGESPRVLMAKVTLQEAQQDYNASIELCKKWIDVEPQNMNAKYRLMRAYHYNGQRQESYACYEQYGVQHPDLDALAVQNLIYLGRDEDAYALAKQNEQNHQHFASQNNMNVLEAARGNLDKALEYIERNLAVEDQDPFLCALANFYAGLVYHEKGNAAKSSEHLERALKKSARRIVGSYESFQYMKETSHGQPKIFWTPEQVFTQALDSAPSTGINAEFGVRFGTSFRFLATHDEPDQQWHGFDSFEGLPEGWGGYVGPGNYSTQGKLPDVPANAKLHQGWFEETLPGFLEENDQPVRIMNIDCDIYSATKTIFDAFKDRFQAGSIIVFDEYIGNLSWKEDEFKAFQEFIAQTGWGYEYLSFNFYTKQVVVKLTEQK